LFCGDFFCGAACAATCRGDCREGDDTVECLIAKALAHMSQPVETRRQNCTETLCISSREEEEEEKRLLRVCVVYIYMCVCEREREREVWMAVARRARSPLCPLREREGGMNFRGPSVARSPIPTPDVLPRDANRHDHPEHRIDRRASGTNPPPAHARVRKRNRTLPSHNSPRFVRTLAHPGDRHVCNTNAPSLQYPRE